MQYRGLVLLASLVVLIGTTACHSQKNPNVQLALTSLFAERPFHKGCGERSAGQPTRGGANSSGGGSFGIVGPNGVVTPQLPAKRARLETADVPLTDVPALTIAGSPMNSVHIAGGNRDHWLLCLCAQGEDSTHGQAREELQNNSMTRAGGLLTLGSGSGILTVDAPADTPAIASTRPRSNCANSPSD